MRSIRAVTLLLACLCCLPACGSRSHSRSDTFRFIDRLTGENIVETPLTDLPSPTEGPDPRYPEESVFLQEMGIPQNPLGLKRRLRLGGTDRNVLFAPPDSTYSFALDSAAESVLEFAVGFVKNSRAEETAPREAREAGVLFRIELEAGGRKRTLFQKFMPQPPAGTDFVFARQRVEIPYALDDVSLNFVTRGENSGHSFWGNPVLHPGTAPEGINIILISVDTLRADHLGCYGYTRDTSPHIDALAADGARFVNTYASSSWTLPSHVSLFTALHGAHHQVYHDDEQMDSSMLTLAEALHALGFTCAAFTGGGFVSPAYGFAKGFESYDVGTGGVFHQDSADRVSRAVTDWIDRHRERNFFLFVHTYQTHSPYACPPPYKVMYLREDSLFGHADLFQHLGGKENLYRQLPEAEKQNLIDLYDGEIRYVDDRLVGPLVGQLKSLGLYDKTLIVFLSDHGEEFFEHGAWGHGQSLYDELLKVPLILKYPHFRFQGDVIETVVSLVDVFPTLLDETEWDAPLSGLDGKSLKPVLEGRETKDRRFLADLGANVMKSHVPKRIAANSGRFKLILNDPYSPQDLDFFQVPPPVVDPVELLDLNSDPGETTNRSDQNPSLASELIRWINDVYAAAQKAQTRKARIDQSVRDQLKALGYIR
jgi:arylsulfatase A-like enzyme